ncbi:Oidioi.mRNA.OKI2018_I69.chr1.g1493.t1.cds [Oikopleura dioica]|uniref:Oidioi.mRNA.OKI2018_I69.chr1.g1493.t1.cds n=1 Tax=Oikopleura dioica TaxID=34765 RepID=A0ABN7SRM9_OIKDI|nr:Oidioi.mRNA.OKI2018_I69.chr1.g1493.t1.cds [Oikopleura dioica]
MENILMFGSVPKLCDFGLTTDLSGRRGVFQMGYVRRGSQRMSPRLYAGSPGFAAQQQISTGMFAFHSLWIFLSCDWWTAWTLLYKPVTQIEWHKIDKIVKECLGPNKAFRNTPIDGVFNHIGLGLDYDKSSDFDRKIVTLPA